MDSSLEEWEGSFTTTRQPIWTRRRLDAESSGVGNQPKQYRWRLHIKMLVFCRQMQASSHLFCVFSLKQQVTTMSLVDRWRTTSINLWFLSCHLTSMVCLSHASKLRNWNAELDNHYVSLLRRGRHSRHSDLDRGSLYRAGISVHVLIPSQDTLSDGSFSSWHFWSMGTSRHWIGPLDVIRWGSRWNKTQRLCFWVCQTAGQPQ